MSGFSLTFSPLSASPFSPSKINCQNFPSPLGVGVGNLLLDQADDVLSSGGSKESSMETSPVFKTPLMPAPKRKKTATSSSVTRQTRPIKTPTSTSSAKYPTSTSLSSASTGRSPRPIFIIAIAEGRGHAKGEIGLAAMDLRHPQLLLSQFSDSSAYSRLRVKLQVFEPVEILMPESALERGGNMAALAELLQSDFPEMQLTTVHRKHFNDARGLELINSLKAVECSSVTKDISEKYYCLASAAALFKYVELIQNMSYAPHSLKITFSGVENTCMIDLTTVKHLELIMSLKDDKKTEASLFGVLNSTRTSCGARMLRSHLLQPPTDWEHIQLRLDTVQELLENPEAFRNLRSVVGRMVDVEQLVSLCVYQPLVDTIKTAEYKIGQVIALKHSLELVEPLRNALSPCTNQLFSTFNEQMLCDVRFEEMMAEIGEIVNDRVSIERGALEMRTHKCFAVRPGICGLLDVARRTYTELVQDVNTLVANLNEESGLPFRTMYNASRGFFLQLPTRNRRGGGQTSITVPDVCINVVQQRASLSCTTRNLIRLNDRITQSVNEIFMISNGVVVELLGRLRSSVSCLYNLTEALAVIDMTISLAQFSSTTDCTRPEFTDSLVVRKGRHPLLDRLTTRDVIANDTYAAQDANFVIITGPNMAGKSTLLKQVASLQVLAQIGCFVPADFASFRITDQIFSRIGHNDDLETERSAFMVEMSDVNYIIQNLTPNSLVIIDELGRSTATEEGIGLCHAICEHLISSKAFVFFATHFLDLTHLDSLYPNVDNYHFGSQVSQDDSLQEHYTPNHLLRRGPYKGPLYGFEVAECSQMEKSVLERAKEIAATLQTSRQSRRCEDSEVIQERAVFKLSQKLLQVAKYSTMDTEKLRQYLLQLRSRYYSDLKP